MGWTENIILTSFDERGIFMKTIRRRQHQWIDHILRENWRMTKKNAWRDERYDQMMTMLLSWTIMYTCNITIYKALNEWTESNREATKTPAQCKEAENLRNLCTLLKRHAETEKASGREEVRQSEAASGVGLALVLSLRVVYLWLWLIDGSDAFLDGSLDKERWIYGSKVYRRGLSLNSVLPSFEL